MDKQLHMFLWDVITQPYSNFDGGLTKMVQFTFLLDFIHMKQIHIYHRSDTPSQPFVCRIVLRTQIYMLPTLVSWNISSWTIKTCLSYGVNNMASDDLVRNQVINSHVIDPVRPEYISVRLRLLNKFIYASVWFHISNGTYTWYRITHLINFMVNELHCIKEKVFCKISTFA